ncbi:MAG: hypothetical protein B5766_10430 [Candidatus Lumbricidophila eiseniae]|uniref:Peptidase M48 domain-containing protein n=1 Tax=Candidatus Lumbricidiphila eiseniae TaxID=1969409 RepID=A0A2A6FNX9_9MICO|nr:MAG: hypothetical protein B5766_10430 [Candidatus Lumbricidophila eiseniae]
MYVAAAGLALIAVAVAWPVPQALTRARWPARHPAVALALWQSIALTGALSMIGSLLCLGFAPSTTLPDGIERLSEHLGRGPLPPEFGVIHLSALGFASGLTAHLAATVAITVLRTERERRRQHRDIQLLGNPLPGTLRTWVLAHPTPLAYCLPGLRTRTVLTAGLIEALSEEELRAVLEHERAHLDQFHHLVLLSFRAWRLALPWFPMAQRAERAVALLTEMLADDRARVIVGAKPLQTALRTVGDAGDLGVMDSGITDPDAIARRLQRLEYPAQATLER